MTSTVFPSFEEFAAQSGSPRFSDWLRHCGGKDWENGCNHPFTRAIGDGTMPSDAYIRYLIEDYTFITDLASVLGYLVAQAPTMASKSKLSGFLAALTSEENSYFLRSFEALGVAPEVYLKAAQGPVTRAFADLLLRSARSSYAEGLACLLCAEWMYLTWAQREAKKPRPEAFYLAEWIDLHAISAFEAFVGWIREEMDRVGAALSQDEQKQLENLFKRMCHLEVAFFDAAWTGLPA